MLGEPHPGSDWYVHSPELGWRTRPGYSGPVYGVRRHFDRDGSPVSDGPAPSDGGLAEDVRQILFVGDSITFGFRVEREATFAARLADELVRVRALNLAVPGYSSYQGSRLLEACELAPDIVVIAFGANDRRYVLRPEDVDGPERFEREFEAAFPNALARHSHLYRWARAALPAGAPREAAGDGPKRRFAADRGLRGLYEEGVRADRLLARVEPERYRACLVESVRAARGLGARPVLLALPDHPLQAGLFDEAARAREAGDRPAARELLDQVVARGGMFDVLARLELSSLEAELGATAAAEELLVLDRPIHSLHGGGFVHPASEYRAIVEQVAAEEGARFVDASDALGDPAFFLDYCHLTEEGHAVVGALLGPVLAELLAD